MDSCKIFEVVLGAPYRENIPCLMHDTHLCQLDVKMAIVLARNQNDMNTKAAMM